MRETHLFARKRGVAWRARPRRAMLPQMRSGQRGPEFAPFLQKAKDLAPDAVFFFVPAGQGALLMQQVVERELDTEGG